MNMNGEAPSVKEKKALRLPENFRSEVIRLALEGFPLEVCGFMGGVDGKISAMYPTANADRSPDHFMIDPREQVEVMKDLRRRSLEMTAIYHSHPTGPDHPSAEDVRLAFYPDCISVIASLQDREKPSLKAFTIVGGIVEEVEIETIPEVRHPPEKVPDEPEAENRRI
jgi:proteasome lid subunit RPN8/RPN11